MTPHRCPGVLGDSNSCQVGMGTNHHSAAMWRQWESQEVAPNGKLMECWACHPWTNIILMGLQPVIDRDWAFISLWLAVSPHDLSLTHIFCMITSETMWYGQVASAMLLLYTPPKQASFLHIWPSLKHFVLVMKNKLIQIPGIWKHRHFRGHRTS